MPHASSDVLRPDGIHTGDVGMVDPDGQLWIVDRKKDIVITAGGKNVSPSRIETALKSSPYISEASVIGEGRKYLTVLIELDVGTVSEWARANERVVHELPVARDQSRDLHADRGGGASAPTSSSAGSSRSRRSAFSTANSTLNSRARR